MSRVNQSATGWTGWRKSDEVLGIGGVLFKVNVSVEVSIPAFGWAPGEGRVS